MLTSLFSLFYVTGEFHKFLYRGRAIFWTFWRFSAVCLGMTYVFRLIVFLYFCFAFPFSHFLIVLLQ